MHTSDQNQLAAIPSFLSGGAMGKRIQEIVWSSTPLGPPQTWPASLRSALSICLNSNFPIAIYWGTDLTLLYNDAWSAIPGKKHPWALGQPAAKVWPDIWEQIQPQFQKAFTGEAGGSRDALLPMQRHGYTEECYFDFTFTPIIGDSGKVEGVFNAVIETTYRIINERRTGFLQKLAASLAHILSTPALFPAAITAIGENPKDIPFCFIYSINKEGVAVPEGSTLPGDTQQLFKQPWPLNDLLTTGRSVHLQNIGDYLSEVPSGYWPEPPTEALLTGLKGPDGAINGFMVSGISSRRGFNGEYHSFMESVASVVSAAANTLHSLEAERTRAEALTAIDRAKTTFFSNISHEFRTPLTLLLGPVEEALNDANTIPENRFRLNVAFRNALRLQKLVNSLLEFSRIEAGRMEGSFSKVDIAAFTADLASTFRSAIEKAGMQLQVNLGAITDDVYVDRDMWEKIILNLLSNAFKYTREGSIIVAVQQIDNQVHISVADTGIGIPDDQLDKIFNRFHRVENTEGRSLEGTGIGLAMVKELAQLHQGVIRVESKEGEGSTFTVTLPTGSKHLPQEKIIQHDQPMVTEGAAVFVEEALRWLPDHDRQKNAATGRAHALSPMAPHVHHKVLLADDNADMRAYIERLLSEHFEVVTAVDGEDAFEKMTSCKPDLLLCDIMMPRLDGFGLLQKVRSRPDLKQTPVIFLSARAGEEAKVEGLNAGADDYLVKPFSAKELLVRVTNLIRINQVRRETEKQFYQLFLQAPAIINVFRGAEMRYELFHPNNKAILGDVDFTGKTLRESLPELEQQGIFEMLDAVYQTGVTIHQSERLMHFTDKDGMPASRYLNFTYQPWYDLKGQIQGVLNFAIDVTETVEARQKIEETVTQRTRQLGLANDKLQQANTELVRSNKNLEEFAYAASHDLKEPIRKIMFFANRLKESIEDKLNAEEQRYFERLESSAVRMASLVDDLLSYSQVDVQSIQMQAVDLNIIVTQVLDDLELEVERRNAIIQVAALPVVKGYFRQLQQAFQNLIANALKFQQPGVPPLVTISSRIVAAGEVPRESFTTLLHQQYHLIEVTDNGIGFEKGEEEQIFKIFTRLHGSTEYSGTGIGLSIVRKVAAAHNGVVVAKGEPGKGACFQLYLP